MINNIKLAIFDFDDTMAIHRDKDYVEHRKVIGENEYFKKAFENPITFYDDIEPCDISKDLRNLICYLRLHDVKMYCLSGMRMSLHSKAKQSFIDKYYGEDIELISACTQEYKVDVVKILQQVHKCASNEVMFIDDMPHVIELMKQQGYLGILANDVKDLKINERTLLEIMDD